MTSAASAGGSGGARGVGLQDRVFAWAATYLVAEQRLPYDLVPGRVVHVGAQTGFPMDDVAVLTDECAYALFQATAGLGMDKPANSPLAGAVKQAVEQFLVGELPTSDGPPRKVEPGRDALVLASIAAGPLSAGSDAASHS